MFEQPSEYFTPFGTGRKTYWAIWRRGVVKMAKAFVICAGQVAVLWLYLPIAWSNMQANMQDLPLPWSIILSIWLYAMIIIVCVLWAPIFIAQWPIESSPIRPEFAVRLEADVDAVANSLGVQWENEYVGEIQRWLDAGEKLEACRLYHSAAERTWDEVNAGLKEWPAARLREKLAILRTKCGAQP